MKRLLTNRLIRPLLAGVASGVIAAWLTDNWLIRAAIVGVSVWLSTTVLVEFLIRSLLIRPEGGNLPKGLPKPVRVLDQKLVAAKISLQTAPAGTDWSSESVEHWRQAIRDATVEAARSSQAEVVQDVLARRRDATGGIHVQQGWKAIMEAADEGQAEAERLDAQPPAAP